MPATSQPFQRVPSNIIENEDLAWEHFQKAVLDEDINTCYDMSLKDFEHSGVHDLFKICNHIFFLSLLKGMYIYIFIFHSSFFFFTSYVKIYCDVQAGYRIGQDEDLVRDEDSGDEGGI